MTAQSGAARGLKPGDVLQDTYRIDALLGEATPDDRKGEDGEAIEAATGGA